MKTEDILKLMDKLHQTSLKELRIDNNSFSLYLSKNDSTYFSGTTAQDVVKSSDTVPSANIMVNTELQKNDIISKEAAEDNEDHMVIKSPLVGIYYEAPSPDADPFVKIGQKVKKGDVLCIIEAMKIFNEIKSPCDGVIKSIHASNLEVIEFDQELISIGEA